MNGHDVVAVLPTGFGKSLMFHLLPDFLLVKEDKNIVIVASTLNSIIEDQLKVLKGGGIKAGVLRMNVGKRKEQEKLFENFAMDEGAKFSVSPEVFEGRCSIIFAQPEALLSAEGRKLICSKVFQDNVAACVIDEAHCVELWGEDFRDDFKELAALKAFFPRVPTLAPTATPHLVKKLKFSLSMTSAKMVCVNPNRQNIYLNKEMRLNNNFGKDSYSAILEPVAEELAM